MCLSATVKDLLKSDSTCESHVQMKRGPVFLTHSVHTIKCLKQLLMINNQ